MGTSDTRCEVEKAVLLPVTSHNRTVDTQSQVDTERFELSLTAVSR